MSITPPPNPTRAACGWCEVAWFVIGYDVANAIRCIAEGSTGWALVLLLGAAVMYFGYRAVRGLA